MTAWIRRFLNNCKLKKAVLLSGPLTTAETVKASRVVDKESPQKLQCDGKVQRGQVDTQPAEEQRGVVRVPRQNTRKLPNLPTAKCPVDRENGP